MSFDLNLPTVCNHRVFRELVPLDVDRRSLRLAKPLSSAVDIKVYASENQVPKTMYSIIYDTQMLRTHQTRMIYLKSKWRQPKDFFEVTYITIKNYCSKCVGLETLDDTSYNVKGQLIEARDEKLLLQNLEKFTVTEIRSNPFHSFIGTSLVSLLGERISDLDFLSTKITQEINSSLQKFSDMQNQYKQAGRTLTDGETLESIDRIEVNQDENDPTILRADVTCTAKSGKTIMYSQYIRTVEAR